MRTLRRIWAVLPLALSLVTAALAQPASVLTGVQRTFFVSPSGSDANPGTAASPFLTPNAARLAVRALAPSMTGDLVVVLRGGTYALSSALAFDASDSGTGGHSIIWQNYPGEVPILSGGRVITGWTVDTGSVYKATASGLSTRQLFVGGVRCQRARSNSVPAGTVSTAGGYTWGDSSLSSYTRPQDLEIVSRQQWTESRFPVASVSATTVTMATPAWTDANAKGGGVGVGATWAENARELVTVPGYWYDNAGTGTLYYYPRAGETMATATVAAPALETLATVTGAAGAPVNHLSFLGLSFQYATWLRPSTSSGYPSLQAGTSYDGSRSPSLGGSNTVLPRAAMEMTYTSGVAVTRCVFTRLGGAGLALLDGCQNDTVQGCVFTDISGGGILIGNPGKPGPSANDLLSGNLINNNCVHDCGVEYHDSVGVAQWYTTGDTLSHNTFYSLPYTGLSLGWGWNIAATLPNANTGNVVQANLIHDVVQLMNDGGGTYSNGSQLSEMVAQNVVYNITTVNGGVGGAYNAGLYYDDGSVGGTTQGNVVYSTGTYNVHANNNAASLLLRYNTLDLGSVITSTNATVPTQLGNVTGPPSGDPSVTLAAGLDPAYRDLLTLTP